MICPKCKSDKIKIIDYLGVKCIVCSNCGYDETKIYGQTPEQRSSQKAKGTYSVYKAGGKSRTKKL